MLKIENKVVGMLTKGDIVMLLDSDEVASYRLRAYLEPITEGRALLIKKTAVLTALHDRADIMFSLYAKLSARIAREYRRSYNFYNTKLELVLLEFFSKVGVTAPNGRYYLPKLTQTEIAGCLGVRREDVSRRRQDLIQMNAILQDEQGKWYIGPAGLELLK